VGCDIFSWVEVYDAGSSRWIAARNVFAADENERELWDRPFYSAPFRRRTYGLFGFLAGVRNFAGCEALSQPRGLPADAELVGAIDVINETEKVADLHLLHPTQLVKEFHSHSWALLGELLGFRYNTEFWNDRQGRPETYRTLLGEDYFSALERMKALGSPGSVRVVFCFDD
jgi:hypothetical protein